MLRLSVARDYCRMLDAKLNPISSVTAAAASKDAGAAAAFTDQVKLGAQIQGVDSFPSPVASAPFSIASGSGQFDLQNEW